MQLLWGQVSMNARDITLIIYATRPVIIDNICKAPDIDILSSPPIIWIVIKFVNHHWILSVEWLLVEVMLRKASGIISFIKLAWALGRIPNS